MKLTVYSHSGGHDHRPPPGHPERVERLQAVERAIGACGFAPREVTSRDVRQHVLSVHSNNHVRRVETASPPASETALDADTWMSPGSLNAAYGACAAVIDAVDDVLAEPGAGFVACRPPGHHAEPDRPMGFCLFNQIAVGAAYALTRPGIERVGIIDFDVHHGNGTQAWAETEPRARFASIHQGWIYPGTGAAHETGQHGNIINVPVEAGTTGPDWRTALEKQILEPFSKDSFDFLFVSAGFDGHARDPLAGINLNDDDFAWVGRTLAELAQSNAKGRLISTLEGGYDLEALESALIAHLNALKA